MNERKQTIWYNVSQQTHMGVLQWEVYEVFDPDLETFKDLYTKCRDGSYIMVVCNHYFVREDAFPADKAIILDPKFSNLIYIGEK